MKNFNLLIVFLFLFTTLQAQTVKGVISDKEKGDISNAVVALLSKKDSIIKSFTRVKQDGSYSLQAPSNGIYLIMITHPKYGDYLDSIKIDKEIVIENIDLIPKRKILEDVIVKAKSAPIKIKGDTIVYTADSFKVKDGGTVEDLFKKLPGFTVDRNGDIKALGKSVQNLLVDGEEFFGNDPGVVSKTLLASSIDKVELFEKQSDQAAFTGIDDGEKTTTVNLKLKANAKKGTMGKSTVAGGAPKNYDLQTMIQSFKDKRKMAVYGLSGNVGNTDLNWEDRGNYGGNDGVQTGMDENGGMWSSYYGDEFTNFWGGSNGIPQNWNVGVHYNNKSKDDKQSINLGYKFNKVNSNAIRSTYSQTFLPDSTWSNTSNNNAFTTNQRNKLNLTWETKLDSANTVKFTIGASEQQGFSNSFNSSAAFSGNTNINSNYRKTSNNNNAKDLNGNILWMYKFKKIRRTLSVNISGNNKVTENNGNLFSENTFYKNGNLFFIDTIDQLKTNDLTNKGYNAKINYTEPLTKMITASLAYGIIYNVQDKDQRSFDKDNSGKYTIAAPLFSNNFLFKNIAHQPKIGFNFKIKKSNLNVSSTLSINEFEQLDRTKNVTRNYKFNNLNSSLNFNTKLKGNANFNISYNGLASAPTLDQLQPIVDNSNPLVIREGNPNLKQSFTHSINGHFGKWDMLTSRNIFSYFYASFQQNAFSQFSVVDTIGKTTYKTVNVNGIYNASLYFDYNFKWKKPKIHFSISPEFSFSRFADFINSQKNISNNNSYGIGLSVSRGFSKKGKDEEDDIVYINLRNDLKQNTSNASINKATNTKFWSFKGDYNIDAKITKKLSFSTGIEVELRQKDPRFPRNNNFNLWNARLERTIVKDKWLAGFGIKDILNQNRGFNRSFVGYNYTESFYNTLQRYYFVSITHKFNTQKSKTKANAKK
jgi:hypothetical protein